MALFNYLIKIEYDGSDYVGWQFQKNGISIQGTIEKALYKLFRQKITIIGSGRTDKGVHAIEQCANFKINKRVEDKYKFLSSVNFFLKNKFIAITDIVEKKLTFHSRFSAKERVYEYQIINRQGALSLDKKRAWHVKKKLNIDLLKKGAKTFEGTHDFSTFRAASCSAKSPIKKINSIKIKKKDDKISIIFKSKSFLQNQVRSMVGCLEYLACGKWSLDVFTKVFKSKKRKKCAPPAPPYGLYLKKIKY